MSVEESQETEEGPTPSKLSCSPHFEALWFCCFNQMQQYYRLGTLKNCSQKWSAVVNCLTSKTKGSAQVQEILETSEKAKPHIWSIRTPEEASCRWKNLYAHLNEVE
ncbi:uncharacterized protein LOC133789124 isoform X2 [Humulus lupulus]|uniref:uncharacterized protein LOC133789124 isoform X2 n=1 Tax=Humulus lupulus TaxID=3486 RepID=UPI002B40F113|nr:uncharacterized protein LOC133789124 isoform X2 [Humulus lupulus]